jgi:DNA gyrase subunit A
MTNIINRDYNDVMTENMKEYYEEVLTDRAVFDPRDGMKPIHRRILWTMLQHRFASNKAHVKSAKITGAVAGEYHPHGTASIYDAMVKMNQEWYINTPLVDKHGNFGSIYGDEAGAERYTEARLSKFAEEIMLADINKGIVDFQPNFDNSLKEPLILPAKIPLALINGSFGIAAGYSANIPPHNFNETIDEVMKYVLDRNHQISLMPDYPTGAIIINKTEVARGYTTGTTKVVIRAKVTKDEKKHILVVSEIPYMKSLDKIVESIQKVTNDRVEKGKKIPKLIDGIKNLRNRSSKGKINLIIEVKKDVDLGLIENQLYSYTELQTTLPFNLVGVVDGKFNNYTNVNQMAEAWLDFRINTIKRSVINEIKVYKARIHIIEGLMIALDKKNIDDVIAIIRNSKSREEMMNKLMTKYKLTEKQADFIINLRLYKINQIEINALVDEKKELEGKVEELIKYFTTDTRVNEHIIEELKEAKKKYGQTRKTEIQDLKSVSKEKKRENLVADTDHTFICTHKYIKKLNGTIKVQRKGGKGNSIGKIKEGDNPIAIFNVNNKDNILLFTDTGKVYSRKAYEIDSCEIQSFGYNLSGIIKDEKLTNVLAMTDEEMENTDIKIAIGTRYNKIKLVDVSEFRNIYQTGIIATKLNDGDSVIFAQKVNTAFGNSIIACTNVGTTINMQLDSIPTVLRPTFGANIFDNSVINKGDYIVGIDLVTEETSHAFFISRQGLGKRVEVSEFPEQIRGGKGRIGIRAKDGDEIVRVITVKEEDDITIISNTSIMSMDINDTSVLLRPAYGNIIKRLNDGEKILDVTTV